MEGAFFTKYDTCFIQNTLYVKNICYFSAKLINNLNTF